MVYLAVGMTGCSKCKAVLSAEDLKLRLICDRCQSKLCQSCSGLSSTEFRCMGLNKRILRFYCQSCENLSDQYDSLIGRIIDSLRPVFDAGLKTVKEETQTLISSLSQQVTDLADTNRELIELLKPTPVEKHVNQGNSLAKSNKPVVMTQVSTLQENFAPQPSPDVNVRPAGGKVLGSRQPRAANQKTFIRGSVPTPAVAMGSKQDSFAAVARRAQLYIGNVNPNASEDSITQYIKARIPNNEFVLDRLPKRDEAMSKAYKLTTDFEILDILNKPDFWPQGVIVKRFFRPRQPRQ